jgi:hypothetical protein
MNIRFLPLLLLPFLIVSYADAQEREFFFFSPYNMDVTYRQEAAPYIAHVEDNWKFYKIGKKSWKRIERVTMATYQTKTFDVSVQLGVENLKPGFRSKIKYKGKTINFVFGFTD